MRFPRSPAVLTSLGAAGVGLAIVCWHIGRPVYWLDEISTVEITQRRWDDLVQVLYGHEAILAPYYLLMRPWIALSTDEWWVRLSSALAAAAAAGLLVRLAYRLAGPVVALACGGLLIALPAFSRYGQEARPYALLMLATVLATTAWWRLRTTGSRRAGIWYALMAAALPLLHLVGLFLLPAHMVADASLGGPDRWRRAGRTAAWAALGVALSAAWWLRSYDKARGVGQPREASLETWLWMGDTLLGSRALVLIALALALLAVLDLRDRNRREPATVAVAWVAVPLALFVVGGLVRPALHTPRYLTISLAGLALLAGLGCARLGRWAAAAAGAPGRPRTAVAVAAAMAPIVALAVLGLPKQQSMRARSGHGEDIRPLLELTRTSEYRALPIAAPRQAHRPIEVYGRDLLPRLLIRQNAAAAGRLNIDDLPPPQARQRLAGHDRVLFLVWSPRPQVEADYRAAETQLAEFRPVQEHRIRGWVLLLMQRRE